MNESTTHGKGSFPDTRWSLVIAAAAEDGPPAERALNQLCQIYWYPVYGYARRRGLTAHDAEDFTQTFFARMLEKGTLCEATPEKGRMRTFLLTAVQRTLTNQHRYRRAKKRGGDRVAISIDVGKTDAEIELEMAGHESPESAFDRNWAHALLGSAWTRLEEHFRHTRQSAAFEKLRPFLAWGRKDHSYGEIAADLGMREGAVRTLVFRMRAKFREFLEQEVRETVASRAEAEDEIEHLKRVLAAG